MSDEEVQHQRWTLRQLTPAMREAVMDWPYGFDLDIDGVVASFCHYPRAADGNGFASVVKEPSVGNLDHLFAGFDGEIVFYGHHHPCSDIQGNHHYVNPGALGCNGPGLARYAVLSVNDEGSSDVSLRSVPYDARGLLDDYEQRQVPARATIIRIFHGIDEG